MMLTKSPNVSYFNQFVKQQNGQNIESKNALLKRIFETFPDGILLLTEQGELIETNGLARQICSKITRKKTQSNSIPEEIWKTCQPLIESRTSYSGQPLIIETEFTLNKLTTIRIRVQWLKLNAMTYPYLLVILEDRYQSSQSLAIAEVDRYGLTPREAEVWLLRRANYSRKEIAAQLYISLDTVKKHLKSIHAKQEAALDRGLN